MNRFQQAMWLMRRRDPQAQEDGFRLLLLPHAAQHIDELIAEFAREREDQGLRCWLLELIGEARSPRPCPFWWNNSTAMMNHYESGPPEGWRSSIPNQRVTSCTGLAPTACSPEPAAVRSQSAYRVPVRRRL